MANSKLLGVLCAHQPFPGLANIGPTPPKLFVASWKTTFLGSTTLREGLFGPRASSSGDFRLRASNTIRAVLEKEETRTIDENPDKHLILRCQNLAAQAAADVNKPRLQLVEQKVLADGTLDIVRWEGDLMLRIWTPPGFNKTDAGNGYPALILNDGQNLFDDSLSFSGQSWRAAQVASDLILTGDLPPFVIVGIDHAGPLRSYYYNPYKPGTGPGGFRKDAASWPGGGVDIYLDTVVNEILPYVTEKYALSTDPKHRAFGGSSFGGICTLRMALRFPELFGSILVESPSLWIANEKFLREDIAGYRGPWPTKTYIAMGTIEYSGIRPHDPQPQADALLTTYIPIMESLLAENGVRGEDRVKVELVRGASHNEKAWCERLPRALTFLLSHWWEIHAEKQSHGLYFTLPKRLHAGRTGTLYFNKNKSDALRENTSPHLSFGFNDWKEGVQLVALERCLSIPNYNFSDWWMAKVKVPAVAYEMNFAFSDGGETWDNNAGNNFYSRVRTLELAQIIETGGLALSVDQLAARNSNNLYFTAPQVLLAGGPAQIYFNRARSHALRHSPNVKLRYGFNNWSSNCGDLDLKPSTLWKGDGVDWWLTDAFEVPNGAHEMNFVFSDGGAVWDNNGGSNYYAKIKDLEKLKGGPVARPRAVESVDRHEHAGGTLEILTLSKRVGAARTKKSRWTEEKGVRVWLPPGYDKERAPKGGWPVLYLNDGQNMFEDWLAHQGVSWRAAFTAADLIGRKEVPPFVICAIDNVGPMRSLNYLPYVPGTGVGGFRGDCERWPGGGVADYMTRITEEIIPMVVHKYNVSTDPFRVAYGGGSFAGIAALYAAMHYPHVFGSILCESPSLWIAEGKFLGDIREHTGMLPDRMFIGCGTKEYSATRDHDRDDVDDLLLQYYCEAARLFSEKGMRGDRLRFLVEEGAGHHESAWQWRLTGALQFLLSPWWD